MAFDSCSLEIVFVLKADRRIVVVVVVKAKRLVVKAKRLVVKAKHLVVVFVKAIVVALVV